MYIWTYSKVSSLKTDGIRFSILYEENSLDIFCVKRFEEKFYRFYLRSETRRNKLTKNEAY